MKILAIERFKETQKNAQELLKQNNETIQTLYKQGVISRYWSRSDQPGFIFLLDVDSLEHAKKILSYMPLVQQKLTGYNIIPLEDSSFEKPTSEKEIFTLVYVSDATIAVNDAVLKEILDVSRANNAKLSITGMLLYHKDTFFQALEGDEQEVNKLYEKIKKDKRHERVVTMFTQKSTRRIFNEWSMGHAAISADELESVEGLNDFFSDGHCLSDLHKGEVKLLLQVFKEGKWRQKIK